MGHGSARPNQYDLYQVRVGWEVRNRPVRDDCKVRVKL